MKRIRQLVLCATLAIGASTATGGEVFPDNTGRDEALKTYQRLGAEMMQSEIAPPLWAALAQSERRAAGSTRVKVVFDRNPYRVGLVRAGRGGSTIEIGTAFLAAADITTDATAVATQRKRDRDLVKFAQNYIGWIRQEWQEAPGGRSSAPARLFTDFIGWPRAEYDTFRQARRYQEMRIAMTRQTLAWVTAHYLGHEILKSGSAQPTGRELARLERTIDAFASRLTYAAGFSAMPPLVNTMLFVALEDPQAVGPDFGLCRATLIASRALEMSETDPEAARRLGATQPSQEYFAAPRAELERLRSATQCVSIE